MIKHVSILVLQLLFAACRTRPEPALLATLSLNPTTTNTVEASPTPTQWIPPTFTATAINTPTPLPTHMIYPVSLSPTSTPTVSPTPAPIVAAPAGLIYSDSEGQWQIAADGKPTLIITNTRAILSPNRQMAIVPPDCCNCACEGRYRLVDLSTGKSRDLGLEFGDAQWSPDSRYIYYTTRDNNNLSDIWVEDVTTGKKSNLTNTPDRDESDIMFWPARPDILVFYMTPGFPDGEGWIGYLTVMRIDGTGYKVVSDHGVSSPTALSPDGQTIAYVTSTPWYYRLGSQPQQFPWKNLGLPNLKGIYFSSPAGHQMVSSWRGRLFTLPRLAWKTIRPSQVSPYSIWRKELHICGGIS